MTCEALFHHAIEYCTRLHEALIHRDQVGCEGAQKSSTLRRVTKNTGHTTLLAVLIDQFDNLRTKGHAGAVKLLNFLVICEIIFRGVQSTQHG
jgi:hypothetical protein